MIKKTRNGGGASQGEDKTDYQRKLSDKKKQLRDGNVPEFVQEYYAECELIQKRFGG